LFHNIFPNYNDTILVYVIDIIVNEKYDIILKIYEKIKKNVRNKTSGIIFDHL
jgi:hypothetical protein